MCGVLSAISGTSDVSGQDNASAAEERDLPLGKKVILDTNSYKLCCETDCKVTTCGSPTYPPAYKLLSVLTVVYYCPEKNIRYVTVDSTFHCITFFV